MPTEEENEILPEDQAAPKFYLKIENGVVVQKQPNPEEGFIETEDDSIVCGYLYDGDEFTAPAPEVSWDLIRARRNSLLSKSDWTQVGDSPLSTELKQEWKDYRTALRNITEDFDEPGDVIWPEEPA